MLRFLRGLHPTVRKFGSQNRDLGAVHPKNGGEEDTMTELPLLFSSRLRTRGVGRGEEIQCENHNGHTPIVPSC